MTPLYPFCIFFHVIIYGYDDYHPHTIFLRSQCSSTIRISYFFLHTIVGFYILYQGKLRSLSIHFEVYSQKKDSLDLQ